MDNNKSFKLTNGRDLPGNSCAANC